MLKVEKVFQKWESMNKFLLSMRKQKKIKSKLEGGGTNNVLMDCFEFSLKSDFDEERQLNKNDYDLLKSQFHQLDLLWAEF